MSQKLRNMRGASTLPGGMILSHPERVERLIEAVRAGNYFETACKFACLDVNTVNGWRRRGRTEKRGVYRRFNERLEHAEAEAEARAVELISGQMVTDWRAAIAYLGRRFPQRWGKREDGARQDITVRIVHADGTDIKPAKIASVTGTDLPVKS